jgi:hypothetical protein
VIFGIPDFCERSFQVLSVAEPLTNFGQAIG